MAKPIHHSIFVCAIHVVCEMQACSVIHYIFHSFSLSLSFVRSICLSPAHCTHANWKCSVKHFFFSLAFRHVCHFAQNKTKPKAINYISDAGGIYHDIIQFFFPFQFLQKKSNIDTRTREKKICVCSTKYSSLFIDSCMLLLLLFSWFNERIHNDDLIE